MAVNSAPHGNDWDFECIYSQDGTDASHGTLRFTLTEKFDFLPNIYMYREKAKYIQITDINTDIFF